MIINKLNLILIFQALISNNATDKNQGACRTQQPELNDFCIFLPLIYFYISRNLTG